MKTHLIQKTICLFTVGTALFGVALSAKATTIGLADPLGNPSSTADIGYALWDSFVDQDSGAPLTITNATPGATDNDLISSLSLSVAMTGGMVTGSGDRIYNGVGQNCAAFNFTLNGTVSTTIDTVKLQLKFTTPASGTRPSFFTANLNSQSPQSVIETNADTGEEVNGSKLGVVTYSWAGLNLQNGDSIALGITSPADGHVSLDAVRVDASVVPEPSTYVLLALGLGVTLFVRNRRRFFPSTR